MLLTIECDDNTQRKLYVMSNARDNYIHNKVSPDCWTPTTKSKNLPNLLLFYWMNFLDEKIPNEFLRRLQGKKESGKLEEFSLKSRIRDLSRQIESLKA